VAWLLRKRAPERGKVTTAVSPEELFRVLAPSVVTVECFGERSSQLLALGSGIVMAHGDVVTNKHVVEKGPIINVRTRVNQRGDFFKIWPAQVTHSDPDHDLCMLRAAGLDAPPVPLGVAAEIVVGERVYAIGSPMGLDLTISEGIISGLRLVDGERVIQTSAPISEGSSGGGLFDSSGKLVGITTSYVKAGQNLNFALPATLASALAGHRVEAVGAPMAQLTLAAGNPATSVHARLKARFPGTNFEVSADREQVIHVLWCGRPSVEDIREYLRALILRRELPNPEFEFERKDS
jgi:S1-C subfamily serine protease